ncbi:MAG: rod shape-determining protein RodA [Edaphobacter sp.]|uniref:rod shape-determining protein RodA n=1 Tax=Edaphobacter sp. TaxID=1934404 RepID=UPI0023890A86|nr:rod shape-determining protein RodA [Edaphobacter sp.]MDE1177867.1 rod shape-determining protein RodA [Edaphobacter sp.]
MFRLSRYRDFDWVLLGFVLLLSVISVLEIKSATMHTKFHGFETKQVEFLCAGMFLMFVISAIDYHVLLDIAPWAYGFSLLSLIAVKLVGQKVLGARRWINLGGGVHFQPSEWVKLVLIISVARYFWQLGNRELSWREIGRAFALVCVPMGLVLVQPDMGTSLTYFPVLLCGLFLGGIRFKQAALLVVIFTVLIGGIWKSGKLLKPYQKARLTAFIDPDADPKGGGYQIRQSLIAVGSGGIWGKGANKGTQTQGDFLPIPYTDFIFAAFCEEHGFVGALGVLLLYFLILMRLIQNAQTAADLPGMYIIMGVVSVIVFQIAVNIGMVVGLMPVTGIPLPLMSYGGSSILFSFLALGIVMNVRMSRFVN